MPAVAAIELLTSLIEIAPAPTSANFVPPLPASAPPPAIVSVSIRPFASASTTTSLPSTVAPSTTARTVLEIVFFAAETPSEIPSVLPLPSRMIAAAPPSASIEEVSTARIRALPPVASTSAPPETRASIVFVTSFSDSAPAIAASCEKAPPIESAKMSASEAASTSTSGAVSTVAAPST